MADSVKTAAGYAIAPSRWPFLVRLARSPLTGEPRSLDESGRRAAAWCEKRARPAGEVLAGVAGGGVLPDVRAAHPAEFAAADAAVNACPVPMGGAGHLDLLYGLCEAVGAERVVETGVAYGWSSLAVLLSLRNRDGELVSTNLHYSRSKDESVVGCAVPESLRDRWTILRRPDREALPAAVERLAPLDLAHYDSDKSYAGRLYGYGELWRALRIGGVLVSDDIGDNLAFAHFCRMVRTDSLVTDAPASAGRKFVGVLVKRSDRPVREMQF